MIVKLLTEHLLKFLSLTGGCRGSSESTHVKMPHCWKSHALDLNVLCYFRNVLSEEDSEEDVLSGEDREDAIPDTKRYVVENRGKSVGDMPNDEHVNPIQGWYL